ncbi:MAG: hypothetical protein OXE79_09530 [Acidimicrobiaceae bacterium]|nr:hypothetical protein [Acidimicrobiaceae bacterium]MCY4069324.1 hypothetical protein [Acidimicrobiaceae bacterium]MCY4280840.1 hypothetical protein [Acidimicrobiaceae bacterium]
MRFGSGRVGVWSVKGLSWLVAVCVVVSGLAGFPGFEDLGVAGSLGVDRAQAQ